MPSPSKRYTAQRPSPRRGAGASSSLESVDRGGGYRGGGGEGMEKSVARQRILKHADFDPDLVGKRTGVILPPRGEIPLDGNGLEDADAFFDAARSPVPGALPSPGSPDRAYSRRAEKARERERREDEWRRRREELEEEGRRNAGRRPGILDRDSGGGDGDGRGGSGGEGGGAPPLTQMYQPTPRHPGWSDRLMHRAMGVPTEDSPQYTVLSRVSTAAPSTRGSVETIATESRHELRARQERTQLDELARHDASPSEEMERTESGEEKDFEGPVDPPEEMGDVPRERRGLDPVERDHLLEPEDDEKQDEMQVNVPAMPSGKSTVNTVASAFSREDVLSQEDALASVSVKRSAKSAASAATAPLENSLEELADANYNQDYDDDDNDDGGGAMQLATVQDEGKDQFEQEEVGFGDDDAGFDDMKVDDHDALGDSDATSRDTSLAASQQSHKSDASHSSKKYRQSNSRDDQSERSATSATSRQPSREEEDEVREEEEEDTPPKKKSLKVAKARKQAPVTPTSVLRTKKTKKKQLAGHRVNFSTPNGRSTGMAAGNRSYEAVPVSDFKESYPPGEEPRTPGGSVLRRSNRARFKPLKWWKNEHLIYEPQNEEGLLGEAMGDMPVVAGVNLALPTPYKEVRRRQPEKKAKKRGRGDDDSDGDAAQRAKSPFDDRAIRKRHYIHNGESGSVWSETLESATDTKIISRIDNRTFSKLPLSSTRKKSESKVVGFASQAFHVQTDDDDLFPGYIAGNVVIPPRGIKDAEGVGLCSQVFNVGDCQPGSIEFSLADPSGQDGQFDPKTAQRYLLTKGDMFQIPPGNVYRIENHSRTEKANLFWTIIKCTSKAEQEESEEEED